MTSLAINQISPVFTVDGVAMPNRWANELIGMRIERGLSVVGRAILRFIDAGYQLSASTIFKLGTKVEISIFHQGTLLSGVVTGASLEQNSDDHPELVITIDDPGCKLGLDTKVVVHQQMKFSEIVSKMASAAGMQAKTNFGGMDSVTHDYLLQRSTDLVFLDTITRRANCVWWVEDNTINVAPATKSQGTQVVTLGDDLFDFSVRASGLRPVKVQANGWDVKSKQDIVSSPRPAVMTATSVFVDGYTGSGPAKGLGVSGRQLAGDGNPNVVGEANALADSLASAWHAGAIVARGTMYGTSLVAPSVSMQVKNAGPSSGTYTVSEVEHVLRSDGFFTRFVAGPVRPTNLVDTLGNDGPDSGFTMPSLTTAVVTQVKGDPDSWGRVKVKYTGAGEDVASNWARVVSLGGGESRGTVFQPEVNDEVLVGFERGDSRHPVVIGGLFGGKAKLAADDSINGSNGAIAYRRITSRLGHVIELADGTGATEQHIVLALAGQKNKVRLGADEMTIDVQQGNPFTLKVGAAKIAIDNAGNITIEGASIKMKATQTNIEMEAQLALKAKATGAGMTLEGVMVDVKAQANASLQGTAMTTIKGGVVMIN